MAPVKHHTPKADKATIDEFKQKWLVEGNKRYVIFKIDYEVKDDPKIVIYSSPGRDEADYDTFLSEIRAEEIQYAVLAFTYRCVGGGKRSKQCFIRYIPDTLRVEPRMIGNVAAGLLSGILKDISESQFKIGACDMSELSVETILDKVSKFELDPVDRTEPFCVD